METKRVVESLLYYSNNERHLRESLRLSRVINRDSRDWSPKYNPELRNHLHKFSKPHVITLIDLIITTYIISGTKDGRLYDIIKVSGNSSEITKMSKTRLLSDFSMSLNIKDFMPLGGMKQIIWIPYKSENKLKETEESLEQSIIDGIGKSGNYDLDFVIFTEFERGTWSVDNDISDINLSSKLKTSQREILTNILEDLDSRA